MRSCVYFRALSKELGCYHYIGRKCILSGERWFFYVAICAKFDWSFADMFAKRLWNDLHVGTSPQTLHTRVKTSCAWGSHITLVPSQISTPDPWSSTHLLSCQETWWFDTKYASTSFLRWWPTNVMYMCRPPCAKLRMTFILCHAMAPLMVDCSSRLVSPCTSS